MITAVKLLGLGLTCLTPEQVYRVALEAGFPPETAVVMTAIALRESGGCSDAYYGGRTGNEEASYGLWQINVKGNPTLVSALGLSSPRDLFDPDVNARAAYYLWGGNDANLDVAWYINRPGYREKFLQYLPVAQAAAAGGAGTIPGLPEGLGGGDEPVVYAGVPGGLSGAGIALVVLVGFLVLNRS